MIHVVVSLTVGSAVTLGAQTTHTLTIQDNDQPPTVSIRVMPGYESVSEGAGHARFQLVFSERTGVRHLETSPAELIRAERDSR
jgi:hypothetical protein